MWFYVPLQDVSISDFIILFQSVLCCCAYLYFSHVYVHVVGPRSSEQHTGALLLYARFLFITLLLRMIVLLTFVTSARGRCAIDLVCLSVSVIARKVVDGFG